MEVITYESHIKVLTELFFIGYIAVTDKKQAKINLLFSVLFSPEIEQNKTKQ